MYRNKSHSFTTEKPRFVNMTSSQTKTEAEAIYSTIKCQPKLNKENQLFDRISRGVGKDKEKTATAMFTVHSLKSSLLLKQWRSL